MEDYWLWAIAAAAVMFVALAYYSLRFFRKIREHVHNTEKKIGEMEEVFAKVGKDSNALAGRARSRLSDAELEAALNSFISKVMHKAVVRRRG
ncbi:hypothetical protein HZC09_02145 [Candidatus Micrarchaeota archaeon]|nr:hypothetical protein [Candidatus Micrarchaeota archaeon]